MVNKIIKSFNPKEIEKIEKQPVKKYSTYLGIVVHTKKGKYEFAFRTVESQNLFYKELYEFTKSSNPEFTQPE